MKPNNRRAVSSYLAQYCTTHKTIVFLWLVIAISLGFILFSLLSYNDALVAVQKWQANKPDIVSSFVTNFPTNTIRLEDASAVSNSSNDNTAYDDTEIFTRPTGSTIKPPTDWGAAEHLRGIVVSLTDNNRNRTQPKKANPALDYFYLVNGKSPVLPKSAYQTLTQFIQEKNPRLNSYYDRERVVRYIYVALSPSAQEKCADRALGIRLNFIQYLGIRSAFVNLQAARVVIHANCTFYGPYMDELRSLVGDSNEDDDDDGNTLSSPWRRLQIQRLPDTDFHIPAEGTLLQPYHRADYIKVWVAYTYGGMVSDFDILFQPRSAQVYEVVGRYSLCTLGNDVDSPTNYNMTFGVNLGLVYCSAKSNYIRSWLDSYVTNYNGSSWTFNSGILPTNLIALHPEETIFMDATMTLLRGEVMVKPRPLPESFALWKLSSVVHHLSHARNVFITPLLKDQRFNRHSSILARSMRQILYGSEAICTDQRKFPPIIDEDLL